MPHKVRCGGVAPAVTVVAVVVDDDVVAGEVHVGELQQLLFEIAARDGPEGSAGKAEIEKGALINCRCIRTHTHLARVIESLVRKFAWLSVMCIVAT